VKYSILTLIFVLLMPTLGACERSATEFPTNPIYGTGVVNVNTASGREIVFEVEVAANNLAIANGLMYRRHLLEDQGMIFLFPTPRPVSFWMKNTLIPLDIIFIDEFGKIVKIHPKARPKDETLIPSGGPVTTVLEINAGVSKQQGIRVGDHVSWTITKEPPRNEDLSVNQ